VPPLEAWQKVFVSDETFLDSIHGKLGCITCHGGVSGTGGMEAHESVVADPASVEACGVCHADTVAANQDSLHTSLTGYLIVLTARSAPDKMPQIEEMMGNHCENCHTSCGQCHVSRPTSAGGGLSAGHQFKQIPPMNLTCTGCHGSRIENEYKGKNEMADGTMFPADVHFNPNGMSCFDCHSGDQMHMPVEDGATRYSGGQDPACQDCHGDVGSADDGNPQHSQHHLEDLSCQVCHSVAYKNCYSCHVQLSDEDVPFYRIEESEMDFAIGINPEQSESRPWTYVVLRHVPIDPDSFEFYGEDLLPNFDNRPTWVYATPHNIQRNTPQNASCASCHDNADLFLTQDRVAPGELNANLPVIVDKVPEGF
jgi:hypothetical protein